MSRFDQLIGSVGKKKVDSPPELEDSNSDTSKSPTPSSNKAKGKNPDYQRTTVYLPKDIHRELKMAALEDGEEMSDIIEQLISQWLRERQT